MSEHLSQVQLSALVDGELTRDQLALVQQHLAECASCTSKALAQSLLKASTKRAGLRYAPTGALEDRMAAIAKQHSPSSRRADQSDGGRLWLSLAAAAVMLLAVSIAGTALWGRHQSEPAIASANRAALETEMIDQHIATLAANSPPEVISSDRHTVKPWFQGKLPFSFNLPENLPADTKLEGADLTYIHGQPAAQLIYSIGKHRVSVFVTQRTDKTVAHGGPSDHAGFHMAGFNTRDLDAIAVSDVEPSRLWGLDDLIEQAQNGVASHPK
jgi:anti-sigma factor RsiW